MIIIDGKNQNTDIKKRYTTYKIYTNLHTYIHHKLPMRLHLYINIHNTYKKHIQVYKYAHGHLQYVPAIRLQLLKAVSCIVTNK